MNYYAGIDVSLEISSVCVVDAVGKIVREGKVASEPEALLRWCAALGFELTRIGLEAGPLSQWLFSALQGRRAQSFYCAILHPRSPSRGHLVAMSGTALPACRCAHADYGESPPAESYLRRCGMCSRRTSFMRACQPCPSRR